MLIELGRPLNSVGIVSMAVAIFPEMQTFSFGQPFKHNPSRTIHRTLQSQSHLAVKMASWSSCASGGPTEAGT